MILFQLLLRLDRSIYCCIEIIPPLSAVQIDLLQFCLVSYCPPRARAELVPSSPHLLRPSAFRLNGDIPFIGTSNNRNVQYFDDYSTLMSEETVVRRAGGL